MKFVRTVLVTTHTFLSFYVNDLSDEELPRSRSGHEPTSALLGRTGEDHNSIQVVI